MAYHDGVGEVGDQVETPLRVAFRRPLTNVIIVPAADYYQQEELHSEAAMMVDHREKNEGAIVSFYTAIRC